MDLIYLDCFSGISGDMLLSALIDLGFPFSILRELVASLGLDIRLECEEVTLQGIRACRFRVQDSSPIFRNLASIEQVFSRSSLPIALRNDAIRVMQTIAEAESRIHGISVEAVHFHELGAADTIVDVLGTLYAIQYLEIRSIYSSPLPWSSGFIPMDHGNYPGPAPATALLLEGLPCRGVNADMELVTPTGAALVKALRPVFGPLPLCRPLTIGYGAGSRLRRDSVPNLLRIIGAEHYHSSNLVEQDVAVLECEIDDMNPEWMSFLFSVLLSHDTVLDLFTTPVLMKKGRNGILLTVLCQTQAVSEIAGLMIQHSSTLGVRYSLQNRLVVQRHDDRLDTPWGTVRIKVALLPDGSKRIKPEYEDCQAIAIEHSLTLHHVYQKIISMTVPLLPDF
ncbi:MAG TPA: nickel pincer cofactor biosynthesis protein LarC [Syntrophomonadaceae bacterium]|nr:nickel pincer cofactor biosynthesis protein LarC [Syntrophomonadaceae bacterium]